MNEKLQKALFTKDPDEVKATLDEIDAKIPEERQTPGDVALYAKARMLLEKLKERRRIF